MGATIARWPLWCPLPTPLYTTTISQHAARQVYVINTREYYCFHHVFISYLKARRILNAPCLSVWRLRAAEIIILSAGGAETITFSGRRWEYDALSMRWEHDRLSTTRCKYDTLSAICHVITLSTIMLTTARWAGGNEKYNNRGYWRSLINHFGQQRLNSATDRSAAKDGRVLPQFQ